jgi:hypothetical protein
VVTANDTASPGPQVTFRRTSASPADNDGGGAFFWQFQNDAAEVFSAAQVASTLLDASDGTEDVQLSIGSAVNGVIVNNLTLHDGVKCGSPTGSFKGAGTLNAVAVYDDDNLLTDIVQEATARRDGKIDGQKWHDSVPNYEVTEEVREEAEFEEVEIDELRHEEGRAVLVKRTVPREKTVLVPVVDAAGEPVRDKGRPVMAKRQVTRTVVTPARTIVRRHKGADILQAMMDAGFKPWDRRNVVAWFRDTNTLPGMIPAAEWDEQNKPSLGEMTTRAGIAKEIIMTALCLLADEIDALESRVAALEARPSSTPRVP